MTASANHDQAELWNGRSGSVWVDERVALDRMFAPLASFLVEKASHVAKGLPSGCVLDVGCGTGGTTLALADMLGERWQVTGVDISAPMIAEARSRAAHARKSVAFLRADAQTHALPGAQFDLVVSRLGVMFFDDPVAAFANLLTSARRGASLHALAWRSPAENPFMTVAERAAAPMLDAMPARVPGAPGQFGFADAARVERILGDAGWRDVVLSPVQFDCALALADLRTYASRLGPVGLALTRLATHERERVIDKVVDAFAPFVSGNDVRFAAACWHLSARAPA
ncbi:SAM-dependent methyltransferase [Pandoraea morbifera]|uniref:SAM-dependent methyltransferase n=1 Tax=Pandoraea morbifera TaxID=2508300 RepID=A0A5E4SUB8_9BURK|nr:class I SAM-dependent methyltransferase [Pandoraea morbifera]VVD78383.1 SAM-dependent methyltransferase [Pandoraea morbifera]